jgi:hypothetical protein
VASGLDNLIAGEVVVSARLKDTRAIIDKMHRLGEPLGVMLDIWGYRMVTTSETDLEAAATHRAGFWETPTRAQLLLRHGLFGENGR